MSALIVLAEDEADLRTVYATCLRAAGHEVCEAADGAEALDLIDKHHPALLILDVWMPKVNGFEVLEHLRGDPKATTLKVIMLSNLGDADTRLESFSAGVCDYWTKAISLAELCAGVKRVLTETEVACDLG